DEPQFVAPTCDALLKTDRAPYSNARLAYDALRDGHRELVRGNLEASQAKFCKAVRWQSADANMFLDFSRTLLLRRDANAAVEAARRAVALASSPRTQELLGDALARSGDAESARAAWLASAGLSSTNSAAIHTWVESALQEAQRSLRQGGPAR